MAPTRPRIAIDPELLDGDPRRVSLPERYVQAVERAGGTPFVLAPCSPDVLDDVLESVDGVLLAGGDDFDTARLGLEPTSPHAKPVPTEKQDFDFALVERVLARRLPVLGVCYGMQCLGLSGGGRLHQHLPDARPARAEHRGGILHPVDVRAGSKLADVLGVASLTIVSRHHQALESVGEPWIVTATSEDGVIEAIERPDLPFAVGVQWHPELAEPGSADERLFEALVHAAGERAMDQLIALGNPA